MEFASRVTILFGKNGSGKTTLIHAIHKALSFIMYSDNIYETKHVKGKNKKQIIDVKTITNNNPYLHPKSFSKDDFNNHDDKLIEIISKANFCDCPQDIDWKMSVFANNCKLRKTEFIDAFREFYDWHQSTGQLPLFSYFSDSFPHKENNKKGKSIKKVSKLRNFGYFNWDEEEGCTHEWIERLENKIKRLIQFSAQKIIDPTSNTVNEALVEYDTAETNELNHEIKSITDCLRTFSHNLCVNESLKIEVARLWLGKDNGKLSILTPEGNEITFQNLPAGYKRIFSIVLDIAYRSYILSECKSTNIPGIVIIDEIDLHLHPELEQVILNTLIDTFPKVQFIISTHSPLILSSLDQEETQYETSSSNYKILKLFKNDTNYQNEKVEGLYGLSYNSTLVHIMETPENNRFQDGLAKAYQYWKEKDRAKAKKILDILVQKYGSNSPLIKALL